MVSQVPARRSEGRLMTRGERPLMELRRRMDTLFDQLFGTPFSGFLMPEEFDEATRFWDFDVSENENEIVIKAEMPGFEPNELDVQVNDNLLTIAAEHREKSDGQEQFRRYRRTVALPSGVDADKIQANYRNGVLELHIPRSEQAKPKRVQIQHEAEPQGQQGEKQTQQGKRQTEPAGAK